MDIPKNGKIRNEAWKLLKSSGIFKAIGVMLLVCVFIMAAAVIPVLIPGFIPPEGAPADMAFVVRYLFYCVFYMVIASLFMVGMFTYFVKTSRGLKAGVGDIFFGFRRKPVTNALLPFAFFIAILPAFIPYIGFFALMILASQEPSLLIVLAGFVLLILFFVFYIYLLLKYAFVYPIAADPTNQTYALPVLFRLSGKMTKGNKGRIFGMLFIFWLIIFAVTLTISLLVTALVKMGMPEAVAVLVSLLYIAVIMITAVYAMQCFTLLYVKLCDKYFNLKPAEPELDLEIAQALYDTDIEG